MGQYFYIVNTTKKQYLHPHDFNDGLKMGEFARTLDLLAYLLADSQSYVKSDLVGMWKGDSIVITGDYSPVQYTADGTTYHNLYDYAANKLDRISKEARMKEFFEQVAADSLL